MSRSRTSPHRRRIRADRQSSGAVPLLPLPPPPPEDLIHRTDCCGTAEWSNAYFRPEPPTSGDPERAMPFALPYLERHLLMEPTPQPPDCTFLPDHDPACATIGIPGRGYTQSDLTFTVGIAGESGFRRFQVLNPVWWSVEHRTGAARPLAACGWTQQPLTGAARRRMDALVAERPCDRGRRRRLRIEVRLPDLTVQAWSVHPICLVEVCPVPVCPCPTCQRW